MLDTTTPTLEDAKSAVRTFWTFRQEMSDSDTVRMTIEEIRCYISEAKAEGRKVTAEEWHEMAELVDEACDDDGLPRLYRYEVAS